MAEKLCPACLKAGKRRRMIKGEKNGKSAYWCLECQRVFMESELKK